GHHPSQHFRHRVHPDVAVQITDRAVGENKPDVESDECAASSKDKPHETANGAVFLDSVAVVNPYQGEVLDVVKNFEERDAGENVGHAIIAIPPKCDAGD